MLPVVLINILKLTIKILKTFIAIAFEISFLSDFIIKNNQCTYFYVIISENISAIIINIYL